MRGCSLTAAALWAAAQMVVPAVQAVVFRDQAGQIDYHYELVGLPQEHVTFFSRPRNEDKASLLYTLSDMGVIGAVNPSNGALVWRQQLLDDPSVEVHTAAASKGSLAPVDGEGWLASGLGHSVHAWSAVSGRSLWWKDFAGAVVDVAVEASTPAHGAPASTDVVALYLEGDETVLRRLRGQDGEVVWEYREPGHRHGSTNSQPLRVTTSGGKIYIAVLQGPATPSLRVVVVDAHNGQHLEDLTVGKGSDAPVSAEDVLFFGGSSSAAVAVSTDHAHSKVRVNILGTKQKHEFALPEGTADVVVHAPHVSPGSKAPLHLLVHSRQRAASGDWQHQASVLYVDASAKTVRKAHDLPSEAGLGAFAATANSEKNAVFFTRITDNDITLTDSSSPDAVGRWPVKPDESPAHGNNATASHGRKPGNAAAAAAAEVVVKPDGSHAVRAAAVTDEDDWTLIRNGQHSWTRPEGLTGATAAVFAEHPESRQLVEALEQEAHSNPIYAYTRRLKRHWDDLEHLFAFLQSAPHQLLVSVLGEQSSAATPLSAEPKADPFGFHKLAILATRRGRLYGLDAGAPGTIYWSTKVVDLPKTAPWTVLNMYVDDAQGVVNVYAGKRSQSVSVQIESGELVGAAAAPLSLQNGDGEIEATSIVNTESGPVVLSIQDEDEEKADGLVEITGIPVEKCPQDSVVLRQTAASAPGSQRLVRGLRGVRFVVRDGQCVKETTWAFAPPPPFHITDIATRPAHDPVASIGRVLGDRRVLYKYLNPNLAVVSAVDEAASQLKIYLLDTVSGQVLSSTVYDGVDSGQPAECLLFENTFACTFFADYSGGEGEGIKGHHLAVFDLYESREPNEHTTGSLGNGSASSSSSSSALLPLKDAPTNKHSQPGGWPPPPVVSSKAWVVSSPMTALAVTQTRQGITVRQVLAYLPRLRGILALPRIGAVLDARRPVGRAPTAVEMEEGLAPYTPSIEADPLQMLTHVRDVAGVKGITTSETNVESTSLVLAYGLDVFATRVAPSLTFDILDQGFGKTSMLATVTALVLAVILLRPMVIKKQINIKWY